MKDHSKKMNYRISLLREALKRKDLKSISVNPLNALLIAFVLMRSLALRLIPHSTRMYFIRKCFDEKPFEINGANHDFKIYTQYTDELNEFAINRCKHTKRLFYEEYSKILIDRLKVGMNACAVLESGKIVSIFFTSLQNCLIEQVKYTYIPKENEIVITDIYTVNEHRKKGLYSLLFQYSVNYYRKIGIHTFVMWIMKHNRATILAQLSLGFGEIFQTVSMFSWLGFNKTKVNPSIRLLKNL